MEATIESSAHPLLAGVEGAAAERARSRNERRER